MLSMKCRARPTKNAADKLAQPADFFSSLLSDMGLQIDVRAALTERKTGLKPVMLKQVDSFATSAYGYGWRADPSLRVEYCAAWRPPTQDGESADRAAAVR
jgi:hypothetical protein